MKSELLKHREWKRMAGGGFAHQMSLMLEEGPDCEGLVYHVTDSVFYLKTKRLWLKECEEGNDIIRFVFIKKKKKDHYNHYSQGKWEWED